MIASALPDDAGGQGSQFDLTPLIDVVFMLIVFLLLTASAAQYVLTIDTPQTESGAVAESAAVVLYPPERESGVWRLDNRRFADATETVEAIASALREDPERVLVIAIGPEVSAQRLVDGMDLARAAGAEHVDLAVQSPADA